ncbi:MAG: peptidoglycan binding protein CsiV, partial [Gammaproteobacteria bacterium]|nr:peptidoglycan binding protein CsiV [Gammaproteobacteria bacterium]
IVLIAWGANNGYGAEELTDYLARDWYETEVIVFQRGPVMEMNSIERLINPTPLRFPRAMRSFSSAPQDIGLGYVLDPRTQASLEFPVVENLEMLGEAPPPMESSERQSSQGEGEPADATLAPGIAPTLEPDPMIEFLEVLARYEEQLEAQSYRWLPAGRFLMARDARLLRRRGRHQVLLHGRWLQPVPAREEPQPMLIQTGSRLADEHQLEGTLAVTLGRFLHFQARLNYHEPAMGQLPVGMPVSDPATTTALELPPPATGYMVLNQSRRMRSEEIHYIDHPKLGIIVRIDPLALPEDLVAEFEALQQLEE